MEKVYEAEECMERANAVISGLMAFLKPVAEENTVADTAYLMLKVVAENVTEALNRIYDISSDDLCGTELVKENAELKRYMTVILGQRA